MKEEYSKPVGHVNEVMFFAVMYRAGNILLYYIEESVLLGTKALVDSIGHFIRAPSGVFSVCHLCDCRIVQ